MRKRKKVPSLFAEPSRAPIKSPGKRKKTPAMSEVKRDKKRNLGY